LRYPRRATNYVLVVGDIHITDPAAFRAHVPVALATVARHGGRVVAGGNKIELLEGEPMPGRIDGAEPSLRSLWPCP
jgi:uncharacterized protein (DUF1330 family)